MRSSGVLLPTAISRRLDLFPGVRSAVSVILRARLLVVSDTTDLIRTRLVPPGQVIRVSEFPPVRRIGATAFKGRCHRIVADAADDGDGPGHRH